MVWSVTLERVVAGLCVVGLMATKANASMDCSAKQPDGIFEVVALRTASDVVSTIAAIDAYAPAVNTVEFNGTSITWVDGDACLEDWALSELDYAPLWLEDPLLSDVMAGPADGQADHRALTSWKLACGAREMGTFTMVDTGLLLAASPNGSVNVVLEKPLDPESTSALNAALTAAGDDFSATDPVSTETRNALAPHAEAMGAAYRFETTAISRNLLQAWDWTAPSEEPSGRSGGLPQDIVQDAAVKVIGDLVAGIDAAEQDHIFA